MLARLMLAPLVDEREVLGSNPTTSKWIDVKKKKFVFIKKKKTKI